MLSGPLLSAQVMELTRGASIYVMGAHFTLLSQVITMRVVFEGVNKIFLIFLFNLNYRVLPYLSSLVYHRIMQDFTLSTLDKGYGL